MPKKPTIKQIAKLANVSPGTVDRVLHNRGKVSPDKLERIVRILNELDYKSNLHTSAVSLTKHFTIVANIPSVSPGDYWEGMVAGLESGLKEYSDIDAECILRTYDQYDVGSFLSVSEDVLALHPDGVILGPTFHVETLAFCRKLDEADIPYVFVDTVIPGADPVATFSADQDICGRLLGNMFDLIGDSKGKVAIFNPRRSGNRESFNSQQRVKAMWERYRSHGKEKQLIIAEFTLQGKDEDVLEFLRNNPDVCSAAILNSQGHIIADIFRRHGLQNIKIGCFDLTVNNIRHLKDESVAFVIYQNPEKQGFEALKALIEYLIFRQRPDPAQRNRTVQVEVVVKENCPS